MTEDIVPPPSVFPRLSDKTAIPAKDVIRACADLGITEVPDAGRLKRLRRLDLGPRAAQGIGRYPAEPGAPYTTYVPAVDGDGNELGGVRLPDISVPMATYAGWNPRNPATGGQGQIVDMLGSTVPFAPTVSERRLESGKNRSTPFNRGTLSRSPRLPWPRPARG